ncbi:hypothetical protein CMO92_03695 [Candidatus Woesearchaeota archaeon]|nr:hypothetical protein [Candidatus Woesearchaeota archaeon]|tara:strand:+ start:2198 stop:2428 length:231 start_codon:yes stop_codon:yes gene_type:complete
MAGKKTTLKKGKKKAPSKLGQGKKALNVYDVPKEIVEKKEQSERFIKKNPILSVAVAAVSGYVLGKTIGRLFRRRK